MAGNEQRIRLRASEVPWRGVKVPGIFSVTKPFKDLFGVWRTGTSLGVNDLELAPRHRGL